MDCVVTDIFRPKFTNILPCYIYFLFINILFWSTLQNIKTLTHSRKYFFLSKLTSVKMFTFWKYFPKVKVLKNLHFVKYFSEVSNY